MQLLTQLAQMMVLVFVASTMFGVGLMLGIRNIAAALHDRRRLLRVVLANVLVLPAIAFGICQLLDLELVLTVAPLVPATAPGSPALVKLAALLFIMLGALAGWLIGGPKTGPRRILALSCGQPNMAAAFVVASQNFHDPRVVLMRILPRPADKRGDRTVSCRQPPPPFHGGAPGVAER